MNTEGGETEIPMKPATDAFSSVGNIGILVAVGVIVVTLLFYVWRSWPNTSTQGKSSSFSPPPERAVYIETKAKRDIANLEHRDDLKKLLIKRALKTIPILLSLQNEGQSIERLYKKGMLTDDMHFKMKELKAFVDQEFQDVQHEANDLMEGWGEHVWQQAMQFHMMIQKQADSKNEEKKVVEEEKKIEAQHNADQEKTKKAPASASSTENNIKGNTAGKSKSIEDRDSKGQETQRITQDPPNEEEKEKQRGQSKKKSQRR